MRLVATTNKKIEEKYITKAKSLITGDDSMITRDFDLDVSYGATGVLRYTFREGIKSDLGFSINPISVQTCYDYTMNGVVYKKLTIIKTRNSMYYFAD